MIKKMNFFIYALLSASAALAQGDIKGRVADGQKSALPYVTVVLKRLPDSAIVRSVVTDANGDYLLTNVKPGDYLLELSMIGFKKQNFPVKPDTDAGLLILEKSTGMLGEVIIIGKTPLIEKLIDRTVVNVAGSISSEGTTALALLKQLPGVAVSPGGQITLSGKNGVNVMIDGKAMQVSADDLTGMLRGMSSSQIQKIEIMSNPSAKYDAAGTGGMINIIRKVNRASGVTGSVYAGFSQSNYAGYNGGLTINDKQKKYNFYLTNTFVDNKSRLETGLTTNIIAGGLLYQSQVSQNQLTRAGKTYLPSLGLDVYLSQNTTLTFAGSAAVQSSDNLTHSLMTESDGNHLPFANVLFVNNNSDRPYHYTAGARLLSKLDSSGKTLSVDLDYANYRNSPLQQRDTRTTFLPAMTDSDALSLTDQRRRLDIYAAKADYSLQVSKSLKLETGWKSSYVKSVAGLTMTNPSQSDLTVNQEHINAAYINLDQAYQKLTIEAGLRGEQTRTSGNQSLAGQNVVQNYFQLFPTLFLQYKVSEQDSWNLQAGRRIDRPDYSELAPLRIPQTPTLYFQGNPDLKPQTELHGELTYSWHHFLSLTAGYDRFHNYISTLPYLDSDRMTITRIPSNVQGSQAFNLDLGLNKDIFSWWTASYDWSLFMQSFSGQTGSPVSYNLDLNNSFTLGRTLSAAVDFRVISPHQEVGTRFGGYHVLGFGLKQRLFNNKASLSLNLNNILQSENEVTRLNYPDISQYRLVRFDTRALRLNFTYRFGSGKENKTGQVSGAADEQKRSGLSN